MTMRGIVATTTTTTTTKSWWISCSLYLLLLVSPYFFTFSYAERPLADVFPRLDETLQMAHLSHVMYRFRWDPDHMNCTAFNNETINDETSPFANMKCHWYYHDEDLGTQVLLVTDNANQRVAIVFAGTDDLRTSLEDVNVLTVPFGNNSTVRLPGKRKNNNKNDTDSLPPSWIRVHAGFNHAVFMDNIWEQVYSHTKELLDQYPTYALWTTGHSLGAANSILTATAFATLGISCRSVNFGAPQTGNWYWKDYHNTTSPLKTKLGIWRVVLAWDLVARLPELFYHVGHTIQADGSHPKQVLAYYEHYGDGTHFAGVPFGWSSKSYAYLPWALGYHHMKRYVMHLEELEQSDWPTEFLPMNATTNDDDIYDNPPDDWFMADEVLVTEEEEEEDEVVAQTPVSFFSATARTNQLQKRHRFLR